MAQPCRIFTSTQEQQVFVVKWAQSCNLRHYTGKLENGKACFCSNSGCRNAMRTGQTWKMSESPGLLDTTFFYIFFIPGHSQLLEAILSDMCSYLYYVFISRNAIMIPIEFHLLGAGCENALLNAAGFRFLSVKRRQREGPGVTDSHVLPTKNWGISPPTTWSCKTGV